MSGIITDKGERIVGSLKLRSVRDEPLYFVSTYEGHHSNNKTSLAFDVILKLNKDSGNFTSTINISDDCGGETAEESLRKLSRWLMRMGETLRYVEQVSSIPYELRTGITRPETEQD